MDFGENRHLEQEKDENKACSLCLSLGRNSSEFSSEASY